MTENPYKSLRVDPDSGSTLCISGSGSTSRIKTDDAPQGKVEPTDPRRRAQLELATEAVGGSAARTLHVHREPPKTHNPNGPCSTSVEVGPVHTIPRDL